MTTSSAELIFFAALEKASPAERAAYLDEACHGDSDLRRRVERLLEAQDEPLAGNPAEEAPAAGDRPAAASAQPVPEKTDETWAERPGGDVADPVPDFLTPSQKPGSLGRLDHYEVLKV